MKEEEPGLENTSFISFKGIVGHFGKYTSFLLDITLISVR